MSFHQPKVVAACLLAALALPAQAETLGFAADSELATKSIAATATTARVQIRTSAGSRYVRMYNSGTVAAFIACGDVGILAVATASLPLAPGEVAVISCAQQYIAAVTSTTATIYATPGNLP